MKEVVEKVVTTTDQVETLESAKGELFLRRKVTQTMSPRGLIGSSKKRFPANMQVRRMKLVVSPPQTSKIAPQSTKIPSAEKSNKASSVNRSTTVLKSKPIPSNPHPSSRQSLSEPKAPPVGVRKGPGAVPSKQASSHLPMPGKSEAKKSLVFKKPAPSQEKTLKGGMRMRPVVMKDKPLKSEGLMAPPSAPAPPLSRDSKLLKVSHSQPLLLESRDSFLHPALRRLTLDALAAQVGRDSLAWVSQLPRDSLTFPELLKMMNEEDKEATREDDTQSFEALETRLRTPKRGAREPPKGYRKERHSNKENLPLETDTHSIHREEVGTLSCMSRSTSMSDIQVKAECQRDPPVSILRSSSLLTLPGATCSQEVQTSVSISDLVPARDVEFAVSDLESCLRELEGYREEQEKLARQQNNILTKINDRKQKFKQLWGVSPLKVRQTIPSSSPERDNQEAVGPETERKVRFNSGANSTLAFSPCIDSLPTSPLATSLNASTLGLQVLKSDLTFLQTPVSKTPVRARASLATTTPAAVKSLKNKVETAFAALYAEDDLD